MAERVTVKVKAGQTLAAPDGHLIHAGETVEVSRHEADFFVRMGAAEIVPAAPPAEQDAGPDAGPKPGKKAKNGPQSQ